LPYPADPQRLCRATAGGDPFLRPLQRRLEHQLLAGDNFAGQVTTCERLLQRRVYDYSMHLNGNPYV